MAGTSRKKTLDELKNEAIAELERRGYEARGKTPAQIRQMLRERRPKRKSTKLDIGGDPKEEGLPRGLRQPPLPLPASTLESIVYAAEPTASTQLGQGRVVPRSLKCRRIDPRAVHSGCF